VDKAPTGTILVVEDHDSVRIAIARFLRSGGFNVLQAGTPDAAKSFWGEQASRISLLIADINLNTSSGPDLVEELFRGGPAIPVIFVTAAEESRHLTADFRLAGATILQKPFSAEILVQAVRAALEEQSRPLGFTTFFRRPPSPDLPAS
jgi:DNA-binding response OmpR family regulator